MFKYRISKYCEIVNFNSALLQYCNMLFVHLEKCFPLIFARMLINIVFYSCNVTNVILYKINSGFACHNAILTI